MLSFPRNQGLSQYSNKYIDISFVFQYTGVCVQVHETRFMEDYTNGVEFFDSGSPAMNFRFIRSIGHKTLTYY